MHPEWWAARARPGDPGRPSPLAVKLVRRYLRPLVRLAWRPSLSGLEHLPASGPFLLVGNHSGAIASAELLSLAALYLEAPGASRPLAGMAHPFAFSIWPVSRALREIGAIPSTYAAAEAALAAGIPLLVFPGGDHEATRPIWQAYRVDFGGRTGFLRLARAAHVPIVPLGIRGSHFTAPVLWRSRLVLPHLLLGRLMGIKRFPLTLLGVLGAMAIALWSTIAWPWRLLLVWLWLASPLPLLAWVPWTIRMRIGRPIAPEELFGPAGTEADLGAALQRVEAAVAALVRER